MGKVGAPGAAVYTASKHAVEGLTKAAAVEGAASGVRVDAVAPGPVETEMLNRFTWGGERKADFEGWGENFRELTRLVVIGLNVRGKLLFWVRAQK